MKCGTNITTSMHAFKYLPLMCWHSLDFSVGLKWFFGRVESSRFLKFQSTIKAETHWVYFSFIFQSTTCFTSSCIKLPAQIPAQLCDLQHWNSCHQSSLRGSALHLGKQVMRPFMHWYPWTMSSSTSASLMCLSCYRNFCTYTSFTSVSLGKISSELVYLFCSRDDSKITRDVVLYAATTWTYVPGRRAWV